jgi:transcriptional regulator with XRE-family HTH domain
VAERFAQAVGQVLRQARQDRGLTLYDVELRSSGRFKPSSVGGYERGERAISLDRFCELAALFGLPPDRLLSDALDLVTPESRKKVVIDLNRLSRVEQTQEEEAHLVAEFVHKVKARRGDYLTEAITLRSGDLEALALASGRNPHELIANLAPALGERRSPTSDAKGE